VARRKRVAFLFNSLTGGGAERVMCTLLQHSAAECAEFDVTLGLLDDEPAANAPPEWVNVRQLDGRKSFARSVFAVRKLFAEIEPDVSVSFLTRSNVANVLSARAPAVISERANTSAHFGAGPRGAASRAMVRAIYPRASRVIAVSDGVANDLRDNFGVRGERIAAIPNPVDVAAIRAKAMAAPEFAIERPYLVAAGRLVKSKNFDMLIRAFAQAGGDRTLVIMGEGPERDALMQTAQACGVADRVLLPGFASNPYPIMRGADMFVLSSNAEGFPNALVEAMAVGAPVIATNCASGPSEILAESSRETVGDLSFAPHGVIVPPNAPDRMAAALRALDDAALRRSYGEKAATRALAYGATTAKDRYWKVVRAALAEQR
jgi:N-acetylgalactosamine-N,N'-diacetylbacillosaminyl-diphospho-undecaprenol 4-alpha-N-acetylgalactosaminyltransferase